MRTRGSPAASVSSERATPHSAGAGTTTSVPLSDLARDLATQVGLADIDVRLNCPVDVDVIRAISPDAVILATGANLVVAPCHNCHSGLEDINSHYGLGLEIKFISDILYEVMEKPEA